MPQAAAGAVVGWLVGIGITGTAATIIGTAVYIGTALAINAGLNKLGEALAGKPKVEQGGPDSREFTVKGTIEPRQLMYGEARSGGCLAFVGTSGTDNQLLNFVVVYAGHQSESITDVWLDARRIPSANIAGDGHVTLSDFQDDGPRLYVWRYLGGVGQAVDPELDLRYSEWTSDHVGFGITYVHYRLDKSDKVWNGTAPSSFFALVKGRKLYDPRKDSTNGGSGSHRVDNPSTWEWSDNWALCVRDYVSGGSVQYNSSVPDKRLTVGESDSRIDDIYTIAAANIADEDVLIPPASPPTTQKRFNCNVQLSCGTTHRENIEILLAAGAGKLSYVDGKYRIYAGAYSAPTVSLSANDVLGAVEVSTHPSGDENFNQVNGEFMDPARNWTMQTFPTQNNTTYQTDDRGLSSRFISQIATTDNYRAQRIARWHLNQSRNKIIVRFTKLTPKALLIGEWETFDITVPEYGWTAQTFRALEVEDLSDGYVAITARIESASLHADPLVADYTDPVTNIPPIYSIDPAHTVINFVATPARDGIVFTWTANVTVLINEDAVYEIFEHTSSTPFSSATKIWQGNTTYAFIEKKDTTERYYWIRTRLRGATSAETPAGAGVLGRAATLTQWIVRGNATAGGSTASYTGPNDGGGWTGLTGCYSIDSYLTCHIRAKHTAITPAHTFIALDQDPANATDYPHLAYGFHVASSGTVQIYESGTEVVANAGAYTEKTELAITYDGTNVRYQIDRTTVRTVNNPGQRFYGVIAFFRNTINSAVYSLKFGPTINIDLVDTLEIRPSAATEVFTATHAGPTTRNSGTGAFVPCSVTFTPMIQGSNIVSTVVANVKTTLPVGVLSVQGQLNLQAVNGASNQTQHCFNITDIGQKIAIQLVTPVTAGLAFVALVNVDPGTGQNVTVSDIILKVEEIKR